MYIIWFFLLHKPGSYEQLTLVGILNYMKLYHFYFQLQEMWKQYFFRYPDKWPGTTWDGSSIAIKHKSNMTEYWLTFSDDIHFCVSLTKFVEIFTAFESKSQLEFLVLGQYTCKENKDIVLLSDQLTLLAASRGHKLVVQWNLSKRSPFYCSQKREVSNFLNNKCTVH